MSSNVNNIHVNNNIKTKIIIFPTAKKVCNVKCTSFAYCFEIFEFQTVGCWHETCLCRMKNITLKCVLPMGKYFSHTYQHKIIRYSLFLGNNRCFQGNTNKNNVDDNDEKIKFIYLTIIIIPVLILIPITIKNNRRHNISSIIV